MVAGALDEVVEAGAFAAEDEAAVLAEVEVGVAGLAAFVEADDPDVGLLHGFEGAGDVDDLGDADVLGGSGGGFGDDGADGSGAALGEDDAVDTGTVGGAEQGAEVVGVFDSVEGEEEAVSAGSGGGVEQVFEGEEGAFAQESDDALVGVGLGVAGELVAGFGVDADAGGAGELEHAIHARVAAVTCDGDVVQPPGTGPESLFHRMQAVENFHASSVSGGVKRAEMGRHLPQSGLRREFRGRRRVKTYNGGWHWAEHLQNIVSQHRDYFGESDVCTSVRTSIVLTAEAAKQIERENAAIARGLKRHDPELLDQLIETYQHRLMRYLMFLTSRREVAEDLFQEVWIRVLRRGDQYNGKARFDTWIFTIARNLVIDLSRKRTMASLDEMREGGEDERPFEIVEEGPSPLDQFQLRENAAEVQTVLLSLDASYREVLTLRFHEEMSLEEIATVTRAPLSTVKSRLYRGLAALKPELTQLRAERRAAEARS